MMKQTGSDRVHTSRLEQFSINRNTEKENQIRISALLKNHDTINMMLHNFLILSSESPIVMFDHWQPALTLQHISLILKYQIPSIWQHDLYVCYTYTSPERQRWQTQWHSCPRGEGRSIATTLYHSPSLNNSYSMSFAIIIWSVCAIIFCIVLLMKGLIWWHDRRNRTYCYRRFLGTQGS